MDEQKQSVLDTLLSELSEDPSRAIRLLEVMTNVVRPWESLKGEGQVVMHTSRRLTVMGNEVALIESNAPTWILTICGDRFTGKKVFNTSHATAEAQALLDKELIDRGYILMDSKI